MWYPVLLGILTVVSARRIGDKEEVIVRWNEKHTFKALKVSLTSGLTHDIQFWHVEHKSREDFNKGISKVFNFDSTVANVSEYGTKYAIHPVSMDEEMNEMACMYFEGDSEQHIRPTEMLPDVYVDFEVLGTEIISDRKTYKLYYESSDDSDDRTYKNTLWAAYDNATSEWVPVKYEEIAFSNWFGSLKIHDVTEYYNYATTFSDDVFDYSKIVPECVQFGSAEEKDDLDEEEYINQEFEKYKKGHNRKYQDENEHKARREIFKKNLKMVQERNSQNLGYTLSINRFSDRTKAEMFRHQGLIRRSPGEVGNIPFPYTKEKLKEVADTIPSEYDLRLLGVIAPVIDQADCGCCWTMGTTAAVEGALARSNGGRLLRLSNQALIDCAWSYGVAGCDGGSDTGAYKWMMNYGLPTVEEYGTYTDQDGYCSINNMTKLYPIRGFTDVTAYDVDALKVAVVNHGPLSVSVHVTTAFQSYTGGIFFDPECDPTNLNHEVTLVGYGEKDGTTFWILKNSWGTDWGLSGYMHISTLNNACGVTTEPTYVTI